MIGMKEKDMGMRRREREESLGNIEEMLKRKRENVEERAEEGTAFKVSKKTQRSSGKEEGEEKGKLGEMMKKWKEEMGEVEL